MVCAGAVLSCALLLIAAVGAGAQVQDGVKPFVKEDAPVLLLNHVRVTAMLLRVFRWAAKNLG